MCYASHLLRAKAQSALLEYSQHRDVVRQNLRDQLIDAGLTGNPSQMAHEQCADTLPLVPICHGERDLSSSRLQDDVTGSTDNHRSSGFGQFGYERQMVYEIDIQEEGNFLFGKASLWRKEPAIERLGAAVGHCCQQPVAVISS